MENRHRDLIDCLENACSVIVQIQHALATVRECLAAAARGEACSAGSGAPIMSRDDVRYTTMRLGLTRAESEVAAMMVEGMTPAEIAEARGCSAGTVKTLGHRAYRHLGVHRQADLVRLVMSLGGNGAALQRSGEET